MQLVSIEISGFKSFGKKTTIKFDSAITAIVGPNGSGKSNVAEAVRFVLGEQSMKSMRGKQGTDLIFKGSGSLSPLGRASVTAFFDNKKNRNSGLTDGVFSYLQFDEIRITRELYADGVNEYFINDTKVRLKDIQELLATANIGNTGHHMISQGEADRILSASTKERKEMLEDALGLKLYQWRIKETERKLEKTDSHLREGEIARREILPHLNYLKKQVEKIESRKIQVSELLNLYNIYLLREERWIAEEKFNLSKSKNSDELNHNREFVSQRIKELTEKISGGINTSEIQERIKKLSIELNHARDIKDRLHSQILRLEAEEKLLNKNIEKAFIFETEMSNKKEKVFIEREKASTSKELIEGYIDQVKWRVNKHEISELPNITNLLKISASAFFTELLSSKEDSVYIAYDSSELQKELEKIKENKKNLEAEREIAIINFDNLDKKVNAEKLSLDDFKESFYVEERELYENKSKLSEIDKNIIEVKNQEEKLSTREERFLEEIKEGNAVVGSDILKYKNLEDDMVEKRSQVELYRIIERLKIKLEDSGFSNSSDILKEYSEISDRDIFLNNQIDDLNKTKLELCKLINELSENLKREFEVGVEKINKEFNIFFTDMFGGGNAKLYPVEREKRLRKKIDEEMDVSNETEVDTETGIDVEVTLPGKKVKDLSMLSGGERALSSIALLFAISGVNPPPFMVLDETDAALDEANARRYGKSLKSLSKHSKLIVITHNRETMNQSESLYGITVGKDGASKVLSVMFEEASEYAK